MQSKKIIIVVGPTAVGKTDYAIQLAHQHQTQIISADSRQCFRELNIGVAKPSEEQLQLVKHYFIDSHSIREDVNARVFERYALEKTTAIFSEKDVVVMVGGTGLYIKAFCEGLDDVPEIQPGIREGIIEQYESHGLAWLQKQLETEDREYSTKGEMHNPQRMMRALEVKRSSGVSIIDFHKGPAAERSFTIEKIGLTIPREELYKNINHRVDRMMEMGLLEEVRSLMPFSHLNPLRTVGYSELFDHLQGKCTLEEAVEKIKTNTRRYAKRQLTWFRKDDEINWVGA